MSGALVLVAALSMITALNYHLGRKWSRLDHNPWSGKFLGGIFSAPAPGLNPAGMTVDEIRQHGRILMVTSPVIFVLIVAVIALRLLFVGHL